MARKPKYSQFGAKYDHTNDRVFLWWGDQMTSGTLILDEEHLEAIRMAHDVLRVTRSEKSVDGH